MKSSFVTLAGRPSSGKSTLINQICGHKVSIVSRTPQTTRNIIRGVYTESRGQLVFQDTPGYHISEKKLNVELKQITESAVDDAELILYVVDCMREPGEEEKKILEYLAAGNTRIVVAVNKTDLLELPEENKKITLESLGNFLRKNLRKFHKGRDIAVVNVSARTGEGTGELLDAMFEFAPEGEMMYPEDIYTDQDVSFRISEIIREKAINRTMEEVPHSMYVEIADIEMSGTPPDDALWVRAFLVVESESQKGILIGAAGEKIRAIKAAAKREIKGIFPYPVTLDLRVKVNKNWRKKGNILKGLINQG